MTPGLQRWHHWLESATFPYDAYSGGMPPFLPVTPVASLLCTFCGNGSGGLPCHGTCRRFCCRAVWRQTCTALLRSSTMAQRQANRWRAPRTGQATRCGCWPGTFPCTQRARNWHLATGQVHGPVQGGEDDKPSGGAPPTASLTEGEPHISCLPGETGFRLGAGTTTHHSPSLQNAG